MFKAYRTLSMASIKFKQQLFLEVKDAMFVAQSASLVAKPRRLGSEVLPLVKVAHTVVFQHFNVV